MKCGLDRIGDTTIEPGQVGLLTNTSARGADGRTSIKTLREKGVHISRLFAPEHGLHATGADGVAQEDTVYDQVPVISLYGSRIMPSSPDLADLSTFIVDLQDIGVRFYTYLASLYWCIKAVSEANRERIRRKDRNTIQFMVLDRPLPTNGFRVEGNIPEKWGSFLCPLPVPVLYGFTPGEMAKWIIKHEKLDQELKILEVTGWNRHMRYEDTGLVWTSPSPAMTGPEVALLYPGMCFIEGTNLSEGRGTPWPFRWFGAPWLDREIVNHLNALDIPGILFHPRPYTPEEGKYCGESCRGVLLEVDEDRLHSPFEAGLRVLEQLYLSSGNRFEWRKTDTGYFVDSLWGGAGLRLALESDEVDKIVETCRQESDLFAHSGGYRDAIIYK